MSCLLLEFTDVVSQLNTQVSAAVYILVLHLNGEGVIKLGTAEWPVRCPP